MGKEILTVLGAIRPDTLGLSSMHDHIFYDGSAECRRIRDDIPFGCRHKAWLCVNSDDPVTLENVGILKRNAMLSVMRAGRQTKRL